jgi:hypothetical protein
MPPHRGKPKSSGPITNKSPVLITPNVFGLRT